MWTHAFGRFIYLAWDGRKEFGQNKEKRFSGSFENSTGKPKKNQQENWQTNGAGNLIADRKRLIKMYESGAFECDLKTVVAH